MFPASTKGGGVAFGFPDVCKTPSVPAPVPIPYPNGTYEVKNSAAKPPGKNTNSASKVNEVSSITIGKSVGNTALLKHLVNKAHAKGLKVTIDVKFEGKAVIRLQDITLHNYRTTRSNPTSNAKRASGTYKVRSGTEGMEWLLRHLG